MKLTPPARGSVRYRPSRNDWYYVIDVGPRERRKQLTRVGFASKDEAEDAAVRHWATAQDSGDAYNRSPAYRRAAADILTEEISTFRMPDDGPGFVYVVRGDPYLKIGFSLDPERRVIEIRSTGTRLLVPRDLNRKSCALWMYFLGGQEDERQFHRLARNYLVCGEWFWASDPLVRAIEFLGHDRSLIAA